MIQKYITLFAAALIILAMPACGKKDELEAKKAKLVELKANRASLEKEIMELEAEIAKLDSNSANKSAELPVKVMAVTPKTLEHFINVQGQVEARNTIMVSPKLAGTYTQVNITEGQQVGRGQLLAMVDVAVLQKSLDELDVQLSLATSLYNKQKNLWDQKIGSEVQLMQAKTQKEAIEQRIATTKEQIEMGKVTAPIAGVVENVLAKAGEGAIPGMPVCRIVSLNDLTFKANLSEAYLPFVKRGDEVSINFTSVGQIVKGKVNNIGQTINPSNRTVTLSVDLPGGLAMLKANLIGEISIKDASKENALAIPQQFIQKGAEGSFVMVAERDSSASGYIAQKVLITTGMKSNQEVEVLTGLKSGQLLITDGTAKEGEKVKFDAIKPTI